MIEVRSAYADIKVAAEIFIKTVGLISNGDYKATVYEMGVSALKNMGLKKIVAKDLYTIKPTHYTYAYAGDGTHDRIAVEGEIFINKSIDKTLFFMIYGPATDVILEGSRKSCRLEVGIITLDSFNALELLRNFSTVVESALKETIKNNSSAIKWIHFSDSINFNSFEWYQEDNNSFNTPDFDKLELDASKLMRDKVYRSQLRDISQAGFAREQDIFSKGQKQEKEIEQIVKELAEHGLLKTQGLLQCRKRQVPLMRLDEADQMENETVKNLKCGLCGSRYEDELIVKGYSLSDLGKKLMTKSHWMTIFLTDQLLNKGVNADSILWNITEANEEVDLIVGKKDQLWVFELKDRDFGTGDAYALNYRRSKFNANKPVVFTTDKVSNDAKRVFEDIVNEVSQKVKSRVIPLYIEGFSNLDEKLDELMSEAILQTSYMKAKALSDITRYNFLPIIEKVFQLNLAKFADMDDEDLPF